MPDIYELSLVEVKFEDWISRQLKNINMCSSLSQISYVAYHRQDNMLQSTRPEKYTFESIDESVVEIGTIRPNKERVTYSE
jgi:hypothetical protein